jgi:hypothetical protein
LNGFKDWIDKNIDKKWKKIQRETQAAIRWPIHKSPPIRFLVNLAQVYIRGQIIITKDGYIGRAISPLVEAGDLIYVLLSYIISIVLYLIKDYFEVRGEIYIPGIIYREAITVLNAGERILRDFKLY